MTPDRDLLADLDAGLLEPDRAARVRADALADPRSAAVLDALAATRAELAALRDPPVPPEVARRWAAVGPGAGASDAPRAAEPRAARGRGTARVASPRPTSEPHRLDRAPVDARRPGVRGVRRSRPTGRGPRPAPARGRLLGGLLVVAVLAVAGVAVARGASHSAVDVSRVELAAVARSTVGLSDLGPLADPERRAGCLAAVGYPHGESIGGRRVRLDGEPGVLVVLTTGVLGRFRVLVVDDACGPAGGVVLADRVIDG